MPALENLRRQLEAAALGIEPPPPEPDPLERVTQAIRDMQIVIDNGSDKDYAPALESLGDALRAALKVHGDALVQAMGRISINVEAPTVNVEPTPITINPKLEMPRRKPPSLKVSVTARDQHDNVSEFIIEPFTGKLPAPSKPPEHSYE